MWIKDIHYGNRLSLQFDKIPHLELVKEIELNIKDFKPNIIFTHNN